MSAIITVENLGKKYTLRHQGGNGAGYRRFSEELIDLIKWPFRKQVRGERCQVSGKNPPSATSDLSPLDSDLSPLTSHLSPPTSHLSPLTSHLSPEDFWALRNVSFEVQQGEVLGIIGRNGAGKSTLLKILSRITEPSEGRVRLKGRVASLLEVGTGFHPELTGRENVYLNGAVLGMSRAEIRRRFDEIVAFAEVEKFLDTPVKYYSSGMYVRLAFAVAAHLEPEILIVDEVLAVGDFEFQKKCLGKMKDVAGNGRTVLFVSHNMGAVKSLCQKALLIKTGTLQVFGPVAEVIQVYVDQTDLHPTNQWLRVPPSLENYATVIQSIEVACVGKQPHLQLETIIGVHTDAELSPAFFVAVDVHDAIGSPLMQAVPNAEPTIQFRQGAIKIKVVIELPPIIPGRYGIDVWIGTHYSSTLDHIRNAVYFTVEESPVAGRTFPFSADHGSFVPRSTCAIVQTDCIS